MNIKKYCPLCMRDETTIKRWINHHVDYKNDITVRVCYGCHERMHGRRTYHNPHEKQFGKDRGPYEFACAVARLYQREGDKLSWAV